MSDERKLGWANVCGIAALVLLLLVVSSGDYETQAGQAADARTQALVQAHRGCR